MSVDQALNMTAPLAPPETPAAFRILSTDSPGALLQKIRESLRPRVGRRVLGHLSKQSYDYLIHMESEYRTPKGTCVNAEAFTDGARERRWAIARALLARGAAKEAVAKWIVLCGFLPEDAREALLRDRHLSVFDLGDKLLEAPLQLRSDIEEALQLKGPRLKALVRDLKQGLRRVAHG